MIPCRCGGAVEGSDAARSCERAGLAGHCCVRRHDSARANPVGLLAVRQQWHTVRSLLVLNAAAQAAAQWTATLPHAQCIATNTPSSRAWRKLHVTPLHGACCMLHVVWYMLHAACIMLHAACVMRLARKANGSTWCAEGTNRTEFFHVASRRLPPCVGPAEHSPHGLAAPASDPCSCSAGILHAPFPTAAPGPHSAPGTGTQSPHPHILPRPLPTATPGPGPPSLISPHLRISAPGD